MKEIEHFKSCEPFVYLCPECKLKTEWTMPIQNSKCILDSCSNGQCCLKPLSKINYIKNCLHQQLNKYIKLYYQVIFIIHKLK